jgi:hydrogenase-4 component B
MLNPTITYIFEITILIYLLGAVFSLLLSGNQKAGRYVSYSCSSLAALSGIFLSITKLVSGDASSITIDIPSNISYLSISFKLDNIASYFILLISFLVFCVSVYSYGYVSHYEPKRKTSLLGALFNLFAASMLMVVTSGHLFLFLIFWEIMSLVSYFLVIYENEKQEVQKAGILYLIMTHIGTAFITVSFILIMKYTGTGVLDMINISLLPGSVRNIVFIFLVIGFGTKAGIIPLHIWLPHAHPAAPSNISALMSGVMIKMAIYGFIRFIIVMLHPTEAWWGTLLLIVGAVSAILGVANALMDNNMKRLLAYSSIENIGIIIMALGLAIFASANGWQLLSVLSLTAALLHTFNHSAFKGLLFMGAGAVHSATGTKEIEKLGGLIKKMPYTAVFMLVGTMSISVLPPFNGFIGEWLAYQAMFMGISSSGGIMKLVILFAAVILALAGALAAFSFIKLYGIAFLAMPRSSHSEEASEVSTSMLAAMALLSIVCILTGLFPVYIISLLDPISVQLFGAGLTESLSGYSSFLTCPVTVNGTFVFPYGILLIGLLLAALISFIVLTIAGKSKTRKYGTWDCGYRSLNSRMQYSSTGFSKPIRIVFRSIFRPQRELKVEEGSTPYFIKGAKYNVTTKPLFDSHIYTPAIRKIFSFARKARFLIQTGSIHTYLLYIFAAIMLMFLYFALSIH